MSDVRRSSEIKSWPAHVLGSGEAGQDGRTIAEEMAALGLAFIEALCRHLPDQGAAIRHVTKHLLEDPERIADLDCCRRHAD